MSSIAVQSINEASEELRCLSEEIWKNPEIGLEERKAHKLLTDFLETKGFIVDRGYCGMETAFRARFGVGKPNICVICEYDSLPQIGHACGHNLIAEVGIATGLALKAFIASQTNGFTGTVTVMGTPAEESVGGKIILIKRGAFDGIDIALMAHPANVEIVRPKLSCISELQVTFKGKAAHAAAFPWEGVNALDAAVMTYTSISALRQQMKPTWQIHGVFTDGGVKPNIIPEKAGLHYYLRAQTMADLKILEEKVMQCFSGAAMATGCTHKLEHPAETFENMNSNEVLSQMYSDHLQSLGITDIQKEGECHGSSDMGNLSFVVPSIHPFYKITEDEGIHTHSFQQVANTLSAHEKSLTVAKALSLVCIDVFRGGKEILKGIEEKFSVHN